MKKTVDASNYHLSTHCTKGSIHWFEIPEPDRNISSLKVRPFIIISRNNHNSKRVLISPVQNLENYIENGQVKYPYHVPLLKSEYNFLEKDLVILLDQVYTIEKAKLYEELFMGEMSNFEKLDNAIMYNFDLYESIRKGITDLLYQYQDLYKKDFSRK
ncbi:type II toxin-antitoxin system PemK/MazF family toxin [Clostridium sp. VAP52]|uniref:type II toxin-antitoxin system PemK/MazF family toxin n=1 Tax=Clostridium sp. VAP52 TaxID=2949977 RepID=UPI0020795B77|nr:type II toxin-antitoxin system PemK/MazF family toxin [Clostridium sp. VAP52]